MSTLGITSPDDDGVFSPDQFLCVTPELAEAEIRRGADGKLSTVEDEDFLQRPQQSHRAPSRRHMFTFIVGGQEFSIQKPFLTMHSPVWAARCREDPSMNCAELPGEADSFGMFINFMQGLDGSADVTARNVLPLLHWGKEFGIDYIAAQCEEVLLTRPPEGIEPTEMLEIAARHNMPLLYSRATEVVAQGMHWVEVPDARSGDPLGDAFNVGGIREDLVSAHISMGLMRNDGQMRRKHREYEANLLGESEQRSRLLWKTRKRFVAPPTESADLDWKSLQVCWPHHSLRGDDWTVVAHEAQPTMPLRARGVQAARQ